jgi:hypothetical protein
MMKMRWKWTALARPMGGGREAQHPNLAASGEEGYDEGMTNTVERILLCTMAAETEHMM